MYPFIGIISGHVRALEQDLDHYRKLAQEQKEVIDQLHRGYALPGKPTYIHPADLAEILNNVDMLTIDLFKVSNDIDVDNVIYVEGRMFKQSVAMPKITTKF